MRGTRNCPKLCINPLVRISAIKKYKNTNKPKNSERQTKNKLKHYKLGKGVKKEKKTPSENVFPLPLREGRYNPEIEFSYKRSIVFRWKQFYFFQLPGVLRASGNPTRLLFHVCTCPTRMDGQKKLLASWRTSEGGPSHGKQCVMPPGARQVVRSIPT